MPIRFQSFEPEHAIAMSDAFAAAWDSLTIRGQAVDPDGTREKLALRIIEMAQAGERNVERLRDDALAFLANSKSEKRA